MDTPLHVMWTYRTSADQAHQLREVDQQYRKDGEKCLQVQMRLGFCGGLTTRDALAVLIWYYARLFR